MDASIVVGDHTVEVLDGPYASNGVATQDAIAFAQGLLGRLDEIRRFAAGRLLPLYNDVWRDEDHGELSIADFESNLVDPSVVIYDEVGAALIYFGDSDMFGGHSIEVAVQGSEIIDAEIVG